MAAEGSVRLSRTSGGITSFSKTSAARLRPGMCLVCISLRPGTATAHKHAGVHGGTRERPQEPEWESEKTGEGA